MLKFCGKREIAVWKYLTHNITECSVTYLWRGVAISLVRKQFTHNITERSVKYLWRGVAPSLVRKSRRAPPLASTITIRPGRTRIPATSDSGVSKQETISLTKICDDLWRLFLHNENLRRGTDEICSVASWRFNFSARVLKVQDFTSPDYQV